MNTAPGDSSGHGERSRRRFALQVAAVLALAAACTGVGAAGRDPGSELSDQVDRGDLAAVKALLAAGANPNHRDSNATGSTLLMRAATRGDVEIIRALLAAGARVNAKSTEGWTALLHAASSNRTEAVKLLLAAKADTDTSVFMLGGGRTPLMLALSSGNVEMARALLEAGASVYLSTSYGATALRFAMWHDTPEMRQLVRQMLAAGAEVDAGRNPPPPSTVHPLEVVAAPRQAEGTALGDVANHGSAQMVQILLDAGARIDARQSGWKTPLMLAATRGNVPVVRLLLEAGADVQARDASGRTALDLAMASGRDEVVQLLRRAATAAPTVR